ncbi:LPP20 family lipoprotein [Treponema primitia]|uniref:LPP20 family lipoprotein n=1 Tax=Treponema primitia TaxID=88058 RepID=UPI0005706636|nr:LPP20 family lipoprotein [Treponema primitia]
MKKPRTGILLFLPCFLLFLYGCASTPAANNSEDEAIALANASLGAMNGSSLAGPPAGSTGINSSKIKPAWVDSPEAVYSRNSFIAGVGSGNNRDQAEKNAFTALSSIFHQSLQADQKIITSYQEAVRNGATADWTENTSVENAIKTSTAMDLAGAEIRDVWSDGTTFYAVAVMEIPKTARLYTQMIQDNQKIIDALVDIPASDRNSMDSLARFEFATTTAEANKVFANVLSVIGAPVPSGMKRPEDYRLEASGIRNTIPVFVSVEGDRDSRIRSAFASVLSSAGFRTGGNNSRYQLQVQLSFSEVQLPNQTTNKFTRYVVDGNFMDTSTGDVLFPYNINGREGHISLPEAEVRATKAAENKIREDYAEALSAYLYRLIPKK